jgi:dihydroneopterin aldolase/D-erythro-7,8-dihydroneopterin triphosphate epimerase
MGASDRPLDAIHIRDLALRCIVGVFAEERKHLQDVIINVTLHADIRAACASDRIEDTVDYKAIKNRIIALVEESSHYLIEALAERVAQACLEDRRVARVAVTIDKPGALRFARSVAVEIEREQPERG